MSDVSRPYSGRAPDSIDPEKTTSLSQPILSFLPPAAIHGSRYAHAPLYSPSLVSTSSSTTASIPQMTTNVPISSGLDPHPVVCDAQISRPERISYVSCSSHDRHNEKHGCADSSAHRDLRQDVHRTTMHFNEEDDVETDHVQENMLRITVTDTIQICVGLYLRIHDRFIFQEFAAPSLWAS